MEKLTDAKSLLVRDAKKKAMHDVIKAVNNAIDMLITGGVTPLGGPAEAAAHLAVMAEAAAMAIHLLAGALGGIELLARGCTPRSVDDAMSDQCIAQAMGYVLIAIMANRRDKNWGVDATQEDVEGVQGGLHKAVEGVLKEVRERAKRRVKNGVQ